MRLAPGTRLGRYEIGSLIGAGGMGEVYRARDPMLRREVAVKVLPERVGESGERLRRFEKEARAAAELEHPNIIAVHDVGVEGETAFIVTELLEGETLADALRRGPLPQARAIEIGIQIGHGVAAAHEKGIVHRDLKPSNVFLCRDGRVKILDFGLAAHVQETTPIGDGSTVTESGAILGTPAYMSPEQVRGQRVDPRADLFALGTILYEMLAGRRPFAGDTAVELGHAILTRDPDPLECPALDAIVRLCVAKDPTARLRSAEDLALLLASLPPPRPAAVARRSRPAWALAVAGGLAAALGVGAVVWPSRAVVHTAPRFTRITFQPGNPRASGARFSPDGRTVLYTWRLPGEEIRVYATTPGRPEARALTEPGTGLVAVGSGGDMLLMVSRGDGGRPSLARAPVTGGVPRILADDVTSADYSPDGRELALVRRVGTSSSLEYPAGRVLFRTPFAIGSPRVSPLGDQVAFIHWTRNTTSGTAFIARGSVELIDRHGVRRALSTSWEQVTSVAWAPDGREVWVTGRRDRFKQLYALPLAGGERRVLELPEWLNLYDIARDGRVLLGVEEQPFTIFAAVPGRSGEIDLSWYDQSVVDDLSSDGRLLLFHEAGEAFHENDEMFVRGTDGSPPVDLGPGFPFALSPDGKWALASPSMELSRLALIPTGAGDPRHLPVGSLTAIAQAYFLADGKGLVIRARQEDGGLRVWMQDLAGGDPRPITGAGISWLARPSPDGRLIVACDPSLACAVYPVAGGAPRPLPSMPLSDRPLQFSPDSRSLLIGRVPASFPVEGRPALYWYELATGRETLFRELDKHDVVPWQFLRLTPDGSSYAYTSSSLHSNLVIAEGLR